MRCPQCSGKLLNVAVRFAGNVSCRFFGDEDFELLENVDLSSEFEEEADCRCLSCGWAGRLQEARTSQRRRPADKQAARPSGLPLTGQELRKLAKAVSQFEGHSQAVAGKLLQEVYRLRSLLEAVTRLSEASRGSRASDEDTWVG